MNAQSALLALEASTEYCSVALAVFSAEANALPQLFIRHEATGAQSSARILPAVREVCEEAKLSVHDCVALACGAGPGSFTGLRTAVGVTQGLAFALNKPVLPVCTLMACAQAARQQQGAALQHVLVALDARMDEVYWGSFVWHAETGQWLTVQAAAVSAPEELVAPQAPFVLAGNAATIFGSRLKVAEQAAVVDTLALPHAAHIATLGWQALQAGHAVPAQQLAPFYIRNKVALTIAERKAAAQSVK